MRIALITPTKSIKGHRISFEGKNKMTNLSRVSNKYSGDEVPTFGGYLNIIWNRILNMENSL